MGRSRLSITHHIARQAALIATAIAVAAGGSAAAQTGPITTFSGLIYQSLRDGDGDICCRPFRSRAATSTNQTLVPAVSV